MGLEIDYNEIRRNVGRFLGYSRTPGSWTTNQAQDVADAIANGLREFYFLRRSETQHVWSFMVRPLSLRFQNGDALVDLPEDFSRLHANIVYGDGTGYSPLSMVDEYEIRAMRAKEDKSGTPLYAAVRAKDTLDSTRSRYELLLYPKSDAEYPVSGRYIIEPKTLESAQDKPLGGSMHSETILEACLSAAEKILNPESGEGVHAQAFERLLTHSIEADKTIVANQEYASWPTDGDDTSELTISKRYLQRLVGRHRGYGPNPDTWTHGEKAEAAEAVRQGLRQFYDPPVLPGERYPHEWSFLSPIARLDLVANQSTYLLPRGFASLDGPLTFVPGDGILYSEIQVYAEHEIRQWLQAQTATSRPWRCATRVVDYEGETRWEIVFAPTPDTAYSVHYRYRLNPIGLKEDVSIPLGGQPHAQTVISSCLQAAEELAGESKQDHYKKYMERLIASVGHDRMASSPDSLGYNPDRSDRKNYYGDDLSWHDYDENLVTYNGVQW